jgi:hypothetical protein
MRHRRFALFPLLLLSVTKGEYTHLCGVSPGLPEHAHRRVSSGICSRRRAVANSRNCDQRRKEAPGPYRFLDTEVRPGATYFYRLEALDRSGGHEFYGPLEATALATAGLPRYTLCRTTPTRSLPGRVELRLDLCSSSGDRQSSAFSMQQGDWCACWSISHSMSGHMPSRGMAGTMAGRTQHRGSTTTGSMPGSSQKDGRW